MKKNYIIIMIALFLSSCQKETADRVVDTAEVDVYVAGFESEGASDNNSWDPLYDENPTYWKNGNPVPLNFDDSRPTNRKSARAMSIAVSGDNVYVAGYQLWLSYNGPLPMGVFWKNGLSADRDAMNLEFTYLLKSVIVSNNDFYMVGWGSGNAGYWKNENKFTLPGNPTTLSIAVSGNDVYVAGASSINGGGVIATYWKNGDPVYLTDGSKDANANSIAVSGSDVYVAGVGEDSVAKYWKNGILMNLTNGPTRGVAGSIAVSGTDVYIAGYLWDGISTGNGTRNPIAIYWRNGIPVKLTDGSTQAWATSIAVSGNDVYVAGSENGVAKYWKNGSPVILGDVSKYSEAYSIFLVKK